MTKWFLRFNGRPNGSIGITHSCTATVEAETEAAAKMKAYETHEYISGGVDGVTAYEVPDDD